MIKSILCLLFVTACSSQDRPGFSPAQVREDVMTLKENLFKYHPGLYRYTAKDSIDYYFEQAASTTRPIDSIALYGRITSVISKVRCGHTRSRMHESLRATLEGSQLFVPFSIKIFDGKYFINQSLDSRLTPGSEILSINAKPIQTVQETIFEHLPSDGWITSGKERTTEFIFDILLQLYATSDAKEFTLTLKNITGEKIKTTVEGRPFAEVNAIRNAFSYDDLLSIKYFDTYAYLKILSFDSNFLSQQRLNYENFLKATFSELKEKGIDKLILDLRGNGGGDDNFGALLVSYLAKDSFNYFDRIEVTPQYPGRFEIIDGQYRWTDHPGLSVWKPQPSAFKGKVNVLIDGLSFSTCADVASVLHYHQWATFIGSETGGGYNGNTSGQSKEIQLPNSKAYVNIPMWKYTTANSGDTHFGRGVIPDHKLSGSWDDFVAKRDIVLEQAVELIEN